MMYYTPKESKDYMKGVGMPRFRLFLILMCLAAVIGGCSVTAGSGSRHRHPVGYTDITLSEIDAVSQLSFESSRLSAYQDIASRPQLSADVQVYLVEQSLKMLSFESSKQSIVMTLVHNPCFMAEGKQAIIDNLNAFSFESSKQAVLAALNKRGSVPSGTMPQPVEVETTVEIEVGYGEQL